MQTWPILPWQPYSGLPAPDISHFIQGSSKGKILQLLILALDLSRGERQE
jgi:hypothetical protein